ncbi:uncharacterized protein LOC143378372 [Andrena cerasifolii]|uniref:uncharacterized protein LOC143378372 n=1 Tax=Andrena cerasifolii TaxID=2819439 RepID=UPI004037A36E
MPRRCCVPGCKGNYDSTLKSDNYISVFLFPKNEELQKKWVAAIPRKQWTPTKYSAVCSLHFADNDIHRYEKVTSPNGTLENVLLRCPKLVENAVPSIFPNLPTYLSKPVPPQRKIPEQRRKEVIQKHERLVEKLKDLDLIENFLDLINKYKEKLEISECWDIKLTNSRIYFYKLDYDNDLLVLNIQIVINDQMKLQVSHRGNEISFNDLKGVLPVDMKLSRWSQLQNLLTRYKSVQHEVPV